MQPLSPETKEKSLRLGQEYLASVDQLRREGRLMEKDENVELTHQAILFGKCIIVNNLADGAPIIDVFDGLWRAQARPDISAAVFVALEILPLTHPELLGRLNFEAYFAGLDFLEPEAAKGELGKLGPGSTYFRLTTLALHAAHFNSNQSIHEVFKTLETPATNTVNAGEILRSMTKHIFGVESLIGFEKRIAGLDHPAHEALKQELLAEIRDCKEEHMKRKDSKCNIM